jgi:tetratricopeptide (TPR) repeat protein
VFRALTRYRLSAGEEEKSLKEALIRLERALPDPGWDEIGWQLWERLAPHCRTLLGRLRNHALEPKATVIMNQLAVWFYNRAEYDEAEVLYQRVLAIEEKRFGRHHPDIAIQLNNLAQLLQATNRLSEAEPLLRRASVIDEASLGPEHPDVAETSTTWCSC